MEEETVEDCEVGEEEKETTSTLLSLVVQKNLPLPPMGRTRLSVTKPKLVLKLILQLEKHSQNFDQLNQSLTVETALLSKIGYKYSCNYRPFHFWSGIRRIIQCCKRINVLNVPGLFTKLQSCLDSYEPAERLTYLPSVRLVEYFLIRFMGSVSLFGTTAFYSSKVFATSKLYLSTITHHVSQHLLIISVTSRLWTLCNSIAKEMINVYTTLFKLRKCFLPTDTGSKDDTSLRYLPENEKFPNDLYAWLKKHMDDRSINFDKPEISKSLSMKKALKKINRVKNDLTLKKEKNHFAMMDDEDIGEPV